MIKINKRNRFIAALLRRYNPGYSTCQKCGLPWNHCKSKTVMYNKHSGTFATCDYCWSNSTLDELKLYYTNVYEMQEASLMRCNAIGVHDQKYYMDHSLQYLLDCVEKEYYKDKTHAKDL